MTQITKQSPDRQPKQVPKLGRLTLNAIGDVVTKVPAVQLQQAIQSLPARLQHDVNEVGQITRLENLANYHNPIQNIDPAAMTRTPNVSYLLPGPYNQTPYVPHRNITSQRMNYDIGRRYLLQGDGGAVTRITGPDFYMVYNNFHGQTYIDRQPAIHLNEATPYHAKAQMMNALQLAANAATSGLGPVVGTP